MINEERTFEDFGYVSGDLSRGSHKKVWVVCEECGKEWLVIYKNYIKRNYKRCIKCVKVYINRVKRGPFTIEYFKQVEESLNIGEVDEIRTLSEFGYYSIDLFNKSKRDIYVICPVCNKSRKVCMGNHISKPSICRPCSMKARFGVERGPFIVAYFDAVQVSIDIGEINEIKTFERFGYYSIDLSVYSNRHIYATCTHCGLERHIKYATYTRSGSICHKCSDQLFENRKRRSVILQRISYSEWEGFAKAQLYCVKFNSRLKEVIREKYNRQCYICNKPEHINRNAAGKYQRLSVHHVDRNKNQGCDDVDWLLIPVCIQCHNRAHTKHMESYITYIIELEKSEEGYEY